MTNIHENCGVLHTKWGTAKISNDGYYRITTGKEGFHDKKLHRLIYEAYYGKIPNGYVIHHIDKNKTNNRIDNLKMMSNSEHGALHQKGKVHSEESKIKMRNAKVGENNPNYGKKFTEEHKRKMSKAHMGKSISDETKRKLSKLNMGENNPNYGKRKEETSQWKNYGRIVKDGRNKRGKQIYAIRYQGKRIKSSIDPTFLLTWFTENYNNMIIQLPCLLNKKELKEMTF